MSARLAAIGALVVLLVLVLIVGPRACQRAQQRAAAAEAGQARAEGQVGAATDATGITINAMSDAAAADDLTRSNTDAIERAEGAGAAMPPAVSDAGLRALCLRPTYRDQPRCAALLGARAGAAR